jgi:signal transduction histidine kinase
MHGLDDARLPATVEAAAFRVLQEALNNVGKHARATRVSVTAEHWGRELVVSIEDDGIGFDRDGLRSDVERTNWGLIGMQERVEGLGGHFSLESAQGQGCSILCRLPLQ